MICRECGAESRDAGRYCPECGCELLPGPPAGQRSAEEAPVVPGREQPGTAAQMSAGREDARAVNHPFAVLSTWDYLWSFVLLGIPVVGLVIAIVWACGGVHNYNRCHMGRACLLLHAAGALLALGMFVGLTIQVFGMGMPY